MPPIKKKKKDGPIIETDVLDDFSEDLSFTESNNRFILAKYFIKGYLILVGLAFLSKLFPFSADLSDVFTILEKLGYIVATITGFYFTKK